jgi:hypothetical protein
VSEPVDTEMTIADDKLRGIAAIAAFIGESERRTHYLIERKLLPYGREGASIIASKKRLLEHHARLTSGEVAA